MGAMRFHLMIASCAAAVLMVGSDDDDDDLDIIDDGGDVLEDAGVTEDAAVTEDGGVDVGDGVADDVFVEDITFEEAVTAIQAGPTRVELEMFEEGGVFVARQLELQEEDDLLDPARLEAEVAAPGFADLTVTGATCEGMLVLGLDPMEVRFDQSTLFQGKEGELLTCDVFVSQIQTKVDTGLTPPILAERLPMVDPAAGPDETAFQAGTLFLQDSDGDGDVLPELETTIDADNLAECDTLATAPETCLGIIRVFGIPVVVRSDTEIQAEIADERMEVDFDGLVQSVDLDRRQMVFTDGAVVRIAVGTEVETDIDGAEGLMTLEEVAAAITAGQRVEATGEAVVESAEPLVLVAQEVELEIEDELTADDFEGVLGFQGRVVGASVDDNVLTLPGGTEVRVAESAPVLGDFESLADVSDAIDAGELLHANVLGTPVAGAPRVFDARAVRVRSRRAVE